MHTVADLIPDLESFVGDSGVCDDPAAVLKYINKIRALLWNKGDFEHTCEWVEICCHDCCLYLPSRLKQIRLAFLGCDPATLQNEWYSSVYGVARDRWQDSCHRSFRDVGGYHVTFRNYPNPYYIRVMPENALDEGKEITFKLKGRYGSEENLTLTFGKALEYTESTNKYLEVLSVSKSITEGRIRVYAYDDIAMKFLLMAIYEPQDKNPSFRKYAVPKSLKTGATIYAKKKYFDLTSGTDLVEFNSETMINGSMALNYRDSRDLANFGQYLSVAVAEANRETADLESPTASPMRIGWSAENHNLTYC